MVRRGLPLGLTVATVAILGAAGWAADPLPVGFWPEPAPPEPSYAERVFAGILPFERVLADREWHPWGSFNWDCTWAVVDLSPDATLAPPVRGRDGGWRLAFGDNGWLPTPLPPPRETTRDALEACARYWDPAIVLRLSSALEAPGSWASRDGVGENLHVYSVPEGIAARIRYGD